MTWVDPESQDTGELITAAIWNQDVVANTQWLRDNLPGEKSCWVYNSSNISWPTAYDTLVTFNSESWDTDSFHSVASNTDRLTAPQDGLYLVGAMLHFNQPDNFQVKVLKNGSTQVGVGTGGGATNWGGFIAIIVDMAQDDYVIVKGRHEEGSTRSMVASGSYGIAAFMVLIGAKPT
ncbi:MAG: hypothetical protein JXJ17_06350 [Anaerolineae bacterium]|nr:hypothetical protein [Anaerolineae bacterium]